MKNDYDLLVIGAGSGGVRAARMSAQQGAKVAVIESRYLGGTCVNVGCVPKKLFVYASEFPQAMLDARGYGLTEKQPLEFSWPTLRDNKNHEISRLNGIYQRILENSGVEIIHGHGEFESAHEVKVGDRVYRAKNILIATGSWPFKPDVPGNEHMMTSNEFFHMDEFPLHAVVIGGGYIAVEFAGILNGLGTDTTLLHRGDALLRGFDRGVRDFVGQELTEAGISIRYNENPTRVEKLESGRYLLHTDQGEAIETDAVIAATGRRPLVEPLSLKNAGVELATQGHVDVNEHFQTNVPHIYAVGDVIGRVPLTPVALAEGMYVSNFLFGQPPHRPVSYELIPTAVFCQPNLGTVGITEQDAASQYAQVDVYESTFKPMKNTVSGNSQRMMMKLLVDVETDRVIGCHMAGADAGEIIQGIGVAMQAGATKAHFDQTIGIHPTAAEEFVTMRSPSRRIGHSVKL